MVLVHLRCGLLEVDIARRFGISQWYFTYMDNLAKFLVSPAKSSSYLALPWIHTSNYSSLFQRKLPQNTCYNWLYCNIYRDAKIRFFVFHCTEVDVSENNSLPMEKTTAKAAETIESTSTIMKTTKRRKNLVRQTGYFSTKHLNVRKVSVKWIGYSPSVLRF